MPPPAADAPPPPADAAPPPPAPPPAPLPSEPAPPPDEAPPAPAVADPEPDLPPADGYSEGGGDAWYDAIEFSAFVDAYYSINYNFPKPQYDRNLLRQFDKSNGFALSWVGVNASYPAEPVGATVSLRFGPTAGIIAGSCISEDRSNCDSAHSLEYVKQAFASFKPGGADSMFQLDFGKFDTPFGAEVAESHLNMNYTRGLLFASQPLFHTGLRANFAVADAFDFKILAVNGWNNTIDNNVGKSLGAQFNVHLHGKDGEDLLTLSLGYMGGPEHDDRATVVCDAGTAFDAGSGKCVSSMGSMGDSGVVDRATSNTKGLRHLIDFVATSNPIERLRLALNVDYGRESVRSSKDLSQFDSADYFGVMLAARVAVIDELGLAMRGEYFRDNGGFLVLQRPEIKKDLVGGTFTIDYLPADFLTIRLDNRLDWSSHEIFDKSVRDQTGTQFTTTLGVVAHTD